MGNPNEMRHEARACPVARDFECFGHGHGYVVVLGSDTAECDVGGL